MFQSFSTKILPLEKRQTPAPEPLEAARELIRRYPSLNEIELARLINLYHGLSSLNMALLLSDEELTPQLDRFSADHRSKIRTPFRQYAALVAYAVVGLAVVAWAVASAL